MKETRLYKVNKLIGRVTSGMLGEKIPDIHWDEVFRIDAFGTDAVSAFAIIVTFHYRDGSQAEIHPEQKGYYKIIELIEERFPSVSDDWFEEMQAAYKKSGWPGDVERALYSAEGENLSK
jgi:hypothetical protein